jgi:hypothetical protein
MAGAALALFALAACETADQTAQSSETIQWNTPRPTDGTPAQPAPPAASPVTPVEPAGPAATTPECREYQTTITIGGKPEKAYGRACRQPDGTWKQVGEHKPAPAAPSKVEQTYPYGWHGYEYPYGPRYGPGYSIGVGAGTGGHGGFIGTGIGVGF